MVTVHHPEVKISYKTTIMRNFKLFKRLITNLYFTIKIN
jgi:hypothetical protein